MSTQAMIFINEAPFTASADTINKVVEVLEAAGFTYDEVTEGFIEPGYYDAIRIVIRKSGPRWKAKKFSTLANAYAWARMAQNKSWLTAHIYDGPHGRQVHDCAWSQDANDRAKKTPKTG